MMALSHALVGVAIATAVPNPLISGPLIFVSHFLLDAIPHWDFGTDWQKRSKAQTGALAIGETILAFILTGIIFWGKLSPLYYLYAFSLAELADWMQAPWFIFFAKQNGHTTGNKKSFFYTFFYWNDRIQDHFHTRATFPFGVITQVITVLFFLILLWKR
jgi:hypothetical protein